MGLRRRESAALPARLAALKESLGVKNQIDFAAALGTDQGTVSKWLNGKSRPLPETLIEIANLAEGADKLFFLEEAGLAPEFFAGSPMLREIQEATTQVVAKTLREGSPTFEALTVKDEPFTIHLLNNPKKLGAPDALQAPNVELALSLPSTWFPRGSDVQAVRFSGQLSPFIGGDMIALVDVSRSDPDRLLGCIVAVRTPTGAEPMTLRKDGATYFLVPLHEDAEHRVRLLKRTGAWSIVGRVLKWIGDAPPAGE